MTIPFTYILLQPQLIFRANFINRRRSNIYNLSSQLSMDVLLCTFSFNSKCYLMAKALDVHCLEFFICSFEQSENRKLFLKIQLDLLMLMTRLKPAQSQPPPASTALAESQSHQQNQVSKSGIGVWVTDILTSFQKEHQLFCSLLISQKEQCMHDLKKS